MSIQIPITPRELRALRRLLKKYPEVSCIDRDSYIKTLLVARDIASKGGHPGKIIKAYTDYPGVKL